MYILTNIPSFIINKKYGMDYSSTGDAINAIGLNLGNCVFWEAAKKIIKSQSELKLISIKEFLCYREFYIGKIDCVVLIIANGINKKVYGQLNQYYEIISKIKCKKYLFSIGAQSRSLKFRQFKQVEKQVYIRFFKQFEYVYLRGQYTYDLIVYNNIPVDNCRVVGCPSILLDKIDIDSITRKFESLKTLQSDNINIGINFPLPAQHKEIYAKLLKLMCDKNVYTLAVDGFGWFDFVNKNKMFDNGNPHFINLNNNHDNFIFDFDIRKTINFIRQHANIMIGTRIHGTIMGLLAGIPSLNLAIDSRTYELCEQMNIPYINCMKETIDLSTKDILIKTFIKNFSIEKIEQLRYTIDTNSKLYRLTHLI